MKKSEEILRAARRVYRKLTTLDFRKADLDLFRDQLPEIWLFRDPPRLEGCTFTKVRQKHQEALFLCEQESPRQNQDKQIEAQIE